LSDQELVSALDAMDQLIRDGLVEPEVILQWRQRFDAALATAERGAGWSQIVARAHDLSATLDIAVKTLSDQRDQIRKELDLQAQGARALKGYKPS
jgi:hypothetical protein